MENRPGALLQIFQAEQARILRLIRRIVGNHATAEELAQDTLVRLWDQPVSAQDRSLVFRTAQNLALDHLRGQAVRSAYAQSVVPEQAGSAAPAPDDAAAARQDLDSMLQALRSLPLRTQRVFLLNRLDGWTYRRIAEALSVSVSTVEKDMIRAIETCRRWAAGREGR